MPEQDNKLDIISIKYLSVLDKSQLVDLLQHKTQLLIAARTSGIKYPNYINDLRREVQLIQAALLTRDA